MLNFPHREADIQAIRFRLAPGELWHQILGLDRPRALWRLRLIMTAAGASAQCDRVTILLYILYYDVDLHDID